MNRRLGISLLLLLGALVSGWLLLRGGDDDAVEAAGEARSGYVLHDFELVSLDKEGKESFSLLAPELRQTPGARTLELTTPLFLTPDQDGQRWEIRSQTGWVSEDSSQVRLLEDVIATSPDNGGRPSTMNTEQLDIYPNENRATSEALVTITSPGSTMRGTGMEADLATKHIRLLSKVHMTHEPNRR